MTADDRAEVATYGIRVTRTLTYETRVMGASVEQAKTFAIADTDPGAFEHPDLRSEDVHTQIIEAEEKD